MAEGRFTQQNFNVFKQDRQKEIITFLNEKKINLDTRITLVEISTFLDTMVSSMYFFKLIYRPEEDTMTQSKMKFSPVFVQRGHRLTISYL